MIRFFIKGLLRDRQRSLLPIIVVSLGVMLAVLIQAWITGVIGDMIDFNARFATGHVKIMTRAYYDYMDQSPNDLAMLDAGAFVEKLETDYPDIEWVERISFGGLMDSPDENGETREQGPSAGLAINLLGKKSSEAERLNLNKILVRGRLPENPGEIILSDKFAQRLKVEPGDPVTLITSTMYGSMSITNFTVAGTINFGVSMLDRGGIIADLSDIRQALDMEDAASEILGYFPGNEYDDKYAVELSNKYNEANSDESDIYSPFMVPLRDMNALTVYLDMVGAMKSIIIFIFLAAMSIVLWNAGLLGGLRRYGEMGLRMAIGEEKGHIYRSLISESLVIGIVGSVSGTLIGLFFAKLLEKGIDFSSLLEGTNMMMTGIYRAQITPECYYIGFIPGVMATVLGAALAGIGIYKRQTAQLFKELQA